MKNLMEREKDTFFQVYKRLPIEVDRAEGCRVYAKDGNVYLDFLAGIAVNALGHSHPAVVEAVCEQAKKYMHISNYFYQEPQIKFAEKLKEMSGMDRVFFSNSGTEATDGAIKLARRYGSECDKIDIIAFSGGFHGRTYGALSVMDKPQYKDKMGPYLSNTKIIEYNNVEELRATINDKTAAVILEFIQGEGGITTATKEFIDEMVSLREKFGFLIIADEIQAGTGRSGKFAAYQHFGFRPDVVTLAKGMGGGMPLGAILATEALSGIWDKGMHGTTYGGNAVACAAGLAVLNELENGVLANTNEVGKYLEGKLGEIMLKYPSKVAEVRGKGLMLGLLLTFDAANLVAEMLKHKVISNAASGKVLRIVPPLNITKTDADEFVSVLDKCLEVM